MPRAISLMELFKTQYCWATSVRSTRTINFLPEFFNIAMEFEVTSKSKYTSYKMISAAISADVNNSRRSPAKPENFITLFPEIRPYKILRAFLSRVHLYKLLSKRKSFNKPYVSISPSCRANIISKISHLEFLHIIDAS